MAGEIYLKKTLDRMAHILSALDRNAAASTFGSFGRNYWSWRSHDMPNASLQYGVYALAWLWKNDPGGKYRDNANLFEWIKAALIYWTKIQNKNGSFNQFFPNEQSVGTTYYTLSAVLYAYGAVSDKKDRQLNETVGSSIAKAARFVSRNDEDYAFISNHVALFAYVNQALSRFLNDGKFKDRAVGQIRTVLDHQSKEGWFPEYGGADPGYQTQCIYYLAEYFRQTGDERVLDSIRKGTEGFLTYFCHPDGSFGGEYGSRDSEIVYPAGFEMLKGRIPACAEISAFVRNSLKEGRILSLDSLDDENLLRVSANYLVAYEHTGVAPDERAIGLPFAQRKVEKDFKEAGIVVRGNDRYYSVANAKKGGIIKIFDKTAKRLVYEDGGYFFGVNTRIITNQMLQDSECSVSRDELRCVSYFYEVLNEMLTPASNIILRILGLTLFRSIYLVNIFRKFLVEKAFTNRKRYPMRVCRDIKYKEDSIIIQDDIAKDAGLRIDRLISGRKAFGVKMASSNYFSGSELPVISRNVLDVDRLNAEGRAQITREVAIGIPGIGQNDEKFLYSGKKIP